MKTLVMAAVLATGFSQTSYAQSTPYLGQIMETGANFCPINWHLADGSLLPINQNMALFALLGTTYGGDGRTTFALPNMKPLLTASRAAVLQCIALAGVFPSRN